MGIKTGENAKLVANNSNEIPALVLVTATYETRWGTCHDVKFLNDAIHCGYEFEAGTELTGDIWSESDYYTVDLFPAE